MKLSPDAKLDVTEVLQDLHYYQPKSEQPMPHLYITIDLSKIEHNTRTIVGLCESHGITVTGVTKGTAENPDVAQAMLRGGVTSIGESQLANIQRLKAADIHTSYMLLPLPSLSEVEDVIALADVSLNSELTMLTALSQTACRRGRIHDVIVMVDLGDLREGVWPPELSSFMHEAAHLPDIRIVGLGTNFACFGGVISDQSNMSRLVQLAESAEHACGRPLPWISGLNSSGLPLLASGQMPRRINHARIGEAILLGRETTHRPSRNHWPARDGGGHHRRTGNQARDYQLRSRNVYLASCAKGSAASSRQLKITRLEHSEGGNNHQCKSQLSTIDQRTKRVGAFSKFVPV